jgi:hypothetical protein
MISILWQLQAEMRAALLELTKVHEALSADIEEQRGHNQEEAGDSERTHQAFQQLKDSYQ